MTFKPGDLAPQEQERYEEVEQWSWCPERNEAVAHSRDGPSTAGFNHFCPVFHEPLFRKVPVHAHTPVTDWEPMIWTTGGKPLGVCDEHEQDPYHPGNRPHVQLTTCLNFRQIAEQVTRCSECSEVLGDSEQSKIGGLGGEGDG